MKQTINELLFSIFINKERILPLTISKSIEKKKNKSQLILGNIKSYNITGKSGNSIIWIGDLVRDSGFKSDQNFLEVLADNFNYNKLLNTGGFFYCIYLNKTENSIEIYSSFLNILPIYYYFMSKIRLKRERES